MKCIISESKFEKIMDNFVLSQMGEYDPLNIGTELGRFIKNGKVVAYIENYGKEGNVMVIDSDLRDILYTSLTSMFFDETDEFTDEFLSIIGRITSEYISALFIMDL
jgi:hypothetical protein